MHLAEGKLFNKGSDEAGILTLDREIGDTMEIELEGRNQAWLEERLHTMLQQHFPDMPQGYPIVICFGVRAKNRFGSISPRNGKSIIRLNGLFADPELPLFVLEETLAHELVHYLHGFGSGLPKRYRHPHQGGVVEQELYARGLGTTHEQAETWRKTQWRSFYEARCPDLTARETHAQAERSTAWESFLEQETTRTEDELLARFEVIRKKLALPEALPIQKIDWLHATVRQTAPSYYFPKQGRVALHGLLADRRVPQSIIDFELAYWLLRLTVSPNLTVITQILAKHKLGSLLTEAQRWRNTVWTGFRNRHHPLI